MSWRRRRVSDPNEETTVLRRHLRAIEAHVDLMASALKQARERRNQIMPAAVAYEVLRRRIIAFAETMPEARKLLEGLPKTLNG